MGYWWLAGVAVAIVIAIWAIQILVGLKFPLQTLSRNYLRQRLQRASIVDRVPADCLNEIAGLYADFLESHGANQGRSWARTELVRCLDDAAKFIVGWVIDGREYPTGGVAFLRDGNRPPVLGASALPDFLKRYSVPLGGAKQ